MLTLFASPKPFKGHIAVIQRNAIQSWTHLRPRPEIILFGEEEGSAQVAAEFGVRHVPDVARNEFGTPLLNGLFGQAGQLGVFPLLAYVNADIILLQDFMSAVERVAHWRQRFLMVGQRWDVEVPGPINFEDSHWESELRLQVSVSGKQRSPWYIDYFVFARHLYASVPPFAIGRTAWDNWLIWSAIASNSPVVDATPGVLAVHQNHDYQHHAEGEKGVWQGEEAKRNLELAGGTERLYNIDHATYQSNRRGGIRWRPLHKPWLEAKDFLWTLFVHRTYGLRRHLGMHRQGWLRIGSPRG